MKKVLVVCLAVLLAGCGQKSTGDWVTQLKDKDVALRQQAVKALGKSGEAGVAVPALAEALKDENAFVRRDAAGALGGFGPEAKPAVPSLTAALKDKEHSVRQAAAQALKKIDPEAATRPAPR